MLLTQVTSTLMLLDHHVDSLLGVIKVELVIFSLLLLRVLLLFVVVQRMLWSISVYVAAADIIDRVRTSASAWLATTKARALGPAENLLLQLHLLTVLFGSLTTWHLLHQVQALEEWVG